MTLAAARGLLSCPRCHGVLHLADAALRCASGHGFDVARQGYVNLLGAAQPHHADTAEMVAARDRVLRAGLYEPVVAALVAELGTAVEADRVVVEVGAGTAWYLSQVIDAHPRSVGVALDISVAAARRAARAHERIASVVADTWARIPLMDGSVDAILCVFAPRNAREFQRILAPEGRLIVVHPNPGHLARLRASSGLLDIDPDKAERVSDQLAAFDVTSRRIAYEIQVTADQASDIVAMGPNAFHHRTAKVEPGVVDIDVQVVTARLA